MAAGFLWLRQALCNAYHPFVLTMSGLLAEEGFPKFRSDCAAGLEILLTFSWRIFKRTVALNCWHITTHRLFQNSSNKLMRDIYEKLIAPHEDQLELYDTFGLSLICSEKKYAHLVSAYILMIPMNHINCSFSLIPRAYYPGMYTIALAKNSPYRGILNFK